MKKLNSYLIFLKLLLVMLAVTLNSGFLYSQCVSCDGTTTSGLFPSAIGRYTKATANYSFAGGLFSEANGSASFAFGNRAIAAGATSAVIGQFARVNTSTAMVFGAGFDIDNPLINSEHSSLMIGFGSTKPTLFVGRSVGVNNTGSIGIGNVTAPQAKLHIRADGEEDATLYLEATGTLKHSRLLFTNEHFIQARNGQNLTFTTQRETHFTFQNGTLRSVNGAALTPAYSFSENANTGMFRPSVNTIAFSTGGQERVRINSGGNVGIGTTTPDKKLVVAGDISFTGDLYKNGVLFNSSNWTVSGSNIYRANGNVGIGTSNPTEKLDISGIVRSTEGFKVGENIVINSNREFIGKNGLFNQKISTGTGPASLHIGGTSGSGGLGWSTAYIGFNADRESSSSWQILTDNPGNPEGNNGGAVIFSTINGDLEFATIKTLKDSGSGGTNQTLTDAQIRNKVNMRLTRDGILQTKEVIVKVDFWSDYVFNPGYELMRINELESFIQTNKHLPDIPSEKEVIEKGINVGEMNALLLKKIEELTLYVIELKRENEVMRHQIEQLAK
ncbi:MAG TPA: hypothetical protein PK904_17960 [Bacteroidales bacterium]|nr:hypothetical protein [Bacteroidales bacterium]HPR58826.1 hypothetical protein [Bacteroidales bacterium]